MKCSSVYMEEGKIFVKFIMIGMVVVIRIIIVIMEDSVKSPP